MSQMGHWHHIDVYRWNCTRRIYVIDNVLYAYMSLTRTILDACRWQHDSICCRHCTRFIGRWHCSRCLCHWYCYRCRCYVVVECCLLTQCWQRQLASCWRPFNRASLRSKTQNLSYSVIGSIINRRNVMLMLTEYAHELFICRAQNIVISFRNLETVVTPSEWIRHPLDVTQAVGPKVVAS